MTRQEQQLILRLWKDWCQIWPQQYARDSIDVPAEGYNPVFDVIPAQAYKDFYFEVVRDYPKLRHLNAFEVIDAALNQVRAPESQMRAQPRRAAERVATGVPEDYTVEELPNVVEVELQPVAATRTAMPEADSA